MVTSLLSVLEPRSFNALRELYLIPDTETDQRVYIRIRAFGTDFAPIVLHETEAKLMTNRSAEISGYLRLPKPSDEPRGTWFTYEFIPSVDVGMLSVIFFHGKENYSNVVEVQLKGQSNIRTLRNRFYIPCTS